MQAMISDCVAKKINFASFRLVEIFRMIGHSLLSKNLKFIKIGFD